MCCARLRMRPISEKAVAAQALSVFIPVIDRASAAFVRVLTWPGRRRSLRMLGHAIGHRVGHVLSAGRGLPRRLGLAGGALGRVARLLRVARRRRGDPARRTPAPGLGRIIRSLSLGSAKDPCSTSLVLPFSPAGSPKAPSRARGNRPTHARRSRPRWSSCSSMRFRCPVRNRRRLRGKGSGAVRPAAGAAIPGRAEFTSCRISSTGPILAWPEKWRRTVSAGMSAFTARTKPARLIMVVGDDADADAVLARTGGIATAGLFDHRGQVLPERRMTGLKVSMSVPRGGRAGIPEGAFRPP